MLVLINLNSGIFDANLKKYITFLLYPFFIFIFKFLLYSFKKSIALNLHS